MTRSKLPGIVADAAVKRRATYDQIEVLKDALQTVVLELLPVAQVEKTQAEIEIARASLNWVTASAHHDLLKLQIELAPALYHDPTLTVGVSQGSRAFVFAAKIGELELQLNTLRERLQRERALSGQKTTGVTG